MATRPDEFPRWASVDVKSHVTNVNNTVEPPESKKNVGWNYGEAPARSFTNWLHRKTYEWLVYLDDQINGGSTVTDGTGNFIFPTENSLITLYAVDKTTPTNFIHAVGYRGTGAPVLNVIANNVLTLGVPLPNGGYSISGGNAEDIIVYGNSQELNT